MCWQHAAVRQWPTWICCDRLIHRVRLKMLLRSRLGVRFYDVLHSTFDCRRWAKCTSAGQMPVCARVGSASTDLASALRQTTTINRAHHALQSMPRPQSSMICRISPQCPSGRTRPTVSAHTIQSVMQSVSLELLSIIIKYSLQLPS